MKKVVSAAMFFVLITALLAGCAGNADNREEAGEGAEPAAAVAEDAAAKRNKAAKEFLSQLRACKPVTADENKMGFCVTGVEKSGNDYVVNWTFSNELMTSPGNLAYAFSLITFYDPADLSHSYQGFTLKDGSIQVDFAAGEIISYDHVRIRGDEFSTDSEVVYLYFGGAPDGPEKIITVPMFYTIVLGDDPHLAEDSPRKADDLFPQQ